MSNKFITQMSAHNFVVREEDAPIPQRVGTFIATEIVQGNAPDELDSASATWGFELRDEAGNLLAHMAPGYWQVFSAVMAGFLKNFANDPAFAPEWVELRKIGLVPACLMTQDGTVAPGVVASTPETS